MLFGFNKETEKEVSSGVLIGYVLVGFAIVLIIAFLVFVVVKKVSGNSTPSEQSVVEQNISTDVETTSGE